MDFGGRARQPPDVVQEALHRAQQVNEIRERQRIELQPLQPLQPTGGAGDGDGARGENLAAKWPNGEGLLAVEAAPARRGRCHGGAGDRWCHGGG